MEVTTEMQAEFEKYRNYLTTTHELGGCGMDPNDAREVAMEFVYNEFYDKYNIKRT